MFSNRLTKVGLALAAVSVVGATAAMAFDRTETSVRRVRAAATMDDTQIAEIRRDQAIELQQSELSQHLKIMAAPFDVGATLQAITDEARFGYVDDNLVASAGAEFTDPQYRSKAEVLMHAYAQWVSEAMITDPSAPLPAIDNAGGPSVASAANAGQSTFGGGMQAHPDLGGVCKACANFDFGPFTPTAAYQTHCSSTSGSGDCNTYKFNCTPGTQYEFTTCSPGSATFDTIIDVNNFATCASLATNDDNCSLQSRVMVTPAAGVTTLWVRVRGFSTASGSYCLAYRSIPPCGTCTSPPVTTTFTPSTASCQSISDTEASCQDNYYRMSLISGHKYEFTTSAASCSGLPNLCFGSATFDTIIEVYSPACALITSNDDCNGLQSRLMYQATTTGTHLVHVRGFSSATGTFVMAYREVPPTPVISSVTPTSGGTGAGATTCGVNQTFTVNFKGQNPVTLAWTITPPSGGTATPASGSTTVSSGGTGTFTSALTRARCGGTQNFSVRVTATNVSGASSPVTITYGLADDTPPAITLTGPTLINLDCAAATPSAPTAAIRDNCDSAPTLTGPTEVRSSAGCPGNFNIVRTWTGRDCNGNTGNATQTLQFRDTHAPVITPSTAGIACLWPPNHSMVRFSLTDLAINATDDCSAPIRFTLVGVTSNQCDDAPCAANPGENGDGSTTGDVVMEEDGVHFDVRAERAGTDPNGRHYSIMVTATDACGNTSAAQSAGDVVVPHDMDEKSGTACISGH